MSKSLQRLLDECRIKASNARCDWHQIGSREKQNPIWERAHAWECAAALIEKEIQKESDDASQNSPSDTESQDITSSLWCRRLTDGRTMVMGFIDSAVLPKGMNDAVVSVGMAFGEIRDETANGVGKSWLDIVETGWKSVKENVGMSLKTALSMFD